MCHNVTQHDGTGRNTTASAVTYMHTGFMTKLKQKNEELSSNATASLGCVGVERVRV